MHIQMNLLTYQSDLDNEAYEYFYELQTITTTRRSEAGYAGDHRGEAAVHRLYAAGAELYKARKKALVPHDEFIKQILELIVETYCLSINGNVFRDIYFVPQKPAVYRPRFARDLRKKVHAGLRVPADALLVFFESGERDYCHYFTAVYIHEGRWYQSHLWDLKDKDKVEYRVKKLYGGTFQADREGQFWSREGFQKAKDEKRLDSQIAGAVFLNYWRFYGRDMALERLGLPPLSLKTEGVNWRDYFYGVVQGSDSRDREQSPCVSESA
ncbi:MULTISPECIES: hypothetical protein [unclassified Paenibacillus]|uniref:hypothetical protein n=1 Tax=unclassified Paenibacillus TaxID=185978 RepID=UPI0027878E57|nr:MULTISPECIES: hypothetical protein [unclassified Paenibacillus]MDQ0896236.1 hypothetical protein [Paenibacillus sp. V4I7]MDQ0913836.1 hypothetical protein [Paenibacillus sp. V4I5]